MIRRRAVTELPSQFSGSILIVQADGSLSMETDFYISKRHGGLYLVTVLYNSDDYEIPLDKIKYWYDIEDVKTLLNKEGV